MLAVAAGREPAWSHEVGDGQIGCCTHLLRLQLGPRRSWSFMASPPARRVRSSLWCCRRLGLELLREHCPPLGGCGFGRLDIPEVERQGAGCRTCSQAITQSAAPPCRCASAWAPTRHNWDRDMRCGGTRLPGSQSGSQRHLLRGRCIVASVPEIPGRPTDVHRRCPRRGRA